MEAGAGMGEMGEMGWPELGRTDQAGENEKCFDQTWDRLCGRQRR